MLKRLNLTVKEALEKRLCFVNNEANPEIWNNDDLRKLSPRLIPYIQKFACTNKCYSSAGSARVTCCGSEEEKDDRRQKTWTNSARLEHSALGFLGWSTALVIAWCTSQPFYRKCVISSDTDSWRYRSMTNVISKVAFTQPGPTSDKTKNTSHDITYSDSHLNLKFEPPLAQQNTARVLGWYTIPSRNQKSEASPKDDGQKGARSSHSVTGFISEDVALVASETKESAASTVQYSMRKYGPPTAEEALDEAADGLAQVQNQVASDINNKLGVKFMKLGRHKDAILRFVQSIKLGNSQALFNIAICYEKGLGVEKNLQEAARYYKLAADKGHAAATYNLGVFHLFGSGGLKKDLVHASELFESASALGVKEAKEALKKISSHLQKTVEEEVQKGQTEKLTFGEKPNSAVILQNTNYKTSLACEMLQMRSSFGFKCLLSGFTNNPLNVPLVNLLRQA